MRLLGQLVVAGLAIATADSGQANSVKASEAAPARILNGAEVKRLLIGKTVTLDPYLEYDFITSTEVTKYTPGGVVMSTGKTYLWILNNRGRACIAEGSQPWCFRVKIDHRGTSLTITRLSGDRKTFQAYVKIKRIVKGK